MRVNVGIRRRLAPLLSNDVDRIKLMNSLLLSMPGSPIIYYGDEIGMGDNIYIGDRNGVRTPMQWSIDRNAGFSRADPQRLYLPVIMDPIYGYQAVNVEAQSRDPSSLLNWTRRILAVRRQHQCFGRGTLEFVRPQNRKIIAYVRTFGAEIVLCVANLSQTAQAVELDLSKYKGRVPVELMGRNAFPPIGDLPYFLTLPAHGFFWLLLSDSAPPPSWHVERLPATELPVLVLSQELATFLPDQVGGPARAASRAARCSSSSRKCCRSSCVRAAGSRVTAAHSLRRGSGRLALAQRAPDVPAVVRRCRARRRAPAIFPAARARVGGRPGHRCAAHGRVDAGESARARARRRADRCIRRSRVLPRSRALHRPTNATVPFAGGELQFRATGEVPALADSARPVDQPCRRRRDQHERDPRRQAVPQGVSSRRGRAESGRRDDELPDARGLSLDRRRWRAASRTWPARPTVLAALFAAVGHQGDVWNYALNHLERYATTLFSRRMPRQREFAARTLHCADAHARATHRSAALRAGGRRSRRSGVRDRAAEERGPVALVQRNSFRRRQRAARAARAHAGARRAAGGRRRRICSRTRSACWRAFASCAADRSRA